MEKKKKNYEYIPTFVHIKIRPTLIKITVLVSITGHMVLAGVWNYLLLCILFSESTSADSGPLPCGVTQFNSLESTWRAQTGLVAVSTSRFNRTMAVSSGGSILLLGTKPSGPADTKLWVWGENTLPVHH